VLSLGAVHSFALEDVVKYLSSKTVRDVLTQAVLDAPVFGVYWRWNASTALAVRRFRNGKKQPAQFQRMDAEDLLSTVFRISSRARRTSRAATARFRITRS
jgi:ATP-dependent Lhr-like helicase